MDIKIQMKSEASGVKEAIANLDGAQLDAIRSEYHGVTDNIHELALSLKSAAKTNPELRKELDIVKKASKLINQLSLGKYL